jgi:hypothetical protein
MDIGSIFLILALLVLVVLYISRPFFEHEAQPEAEEAEANRVEHERSSLLAERDRLLNALQELDFDYALGKIPAEDYPEQRQRLLHNGADVLRRLDALQPQAEQEDAEARLEAAIAARRADAARPMPEIAVQAVAAGGGRKSAVAVAGADDDLEKLLADRRRARREKAAGFCPRCGGPVHKSDRFCPKCGGKIA